MLGILLDQRENVVDYLADVGLAAAVFCALSLVTGYVVPRPSASSTNRRSRRRWRSASHNGTLAIVIAVEVLDSTEISVPAAVYSLIMFVFAALWGRYISVRTAPGRP